MADPVQQLLSQSHWDTIDGVQTIWNFTFSGGYIYPEHVKAYYLDAAGERVNIAVTEDMLIGEFQLQIDTPPVPASATRFVIYRDTPKDLPLIDFEGGAIVSEANLDRSTKQAVFCAAEVLDGATVTGYGLDLLLGADEALQAGLDEVQDDVNNLDSQVEGVTADLAALTIVVNGHTVSIADLQDQIDVLAPDVSDFGYKALKRNAYTGASEVLAADEGKAHAKTDGTAVNVPTGLADEFLCTVINNSSSSMALTFEDTAYLQDGSGDAAASYNIMPRGTATLAKVSSTEWYVSGTVEAA
jgi:tail fiber protein